MRDQSILAKGFYLRDPSVVAEGLLGKRLMRKAEGYLEGVIVESEAYYGRDDPASRAFHGLKGYNSSMWGEPGRTFIYNVHKYWMFNIVAHEKDAVGAVLIRAIEPTQGIDLMKRNRPVGKITELTNGPGKLTIALGIDKSLNNICVTSRESPILVVDAQMGFEVGRSHRIGVRKDLDEKLRFFIVGNRYVSK